MTKELIIGIVFLSPLFFTVIAILSWFMKGLRPRKLIGVSRISIYSSILIALFSALMVYQSGLIESNSLAFNGLGISIRLDALSVLIFTMINLISFVVMRFSFNYMDGDKRQGVFIGRLAATIASVQLLVLSGNVGLLWISWVLTSISLHRLLVFYSERRRSKLAARKKFIAARLSDLFLLGAVLLTFNRFGTGNLEVVFTEMKNFSGILPLEIELASICIVLAAILKSALFPTHAWLVEVMETPTPVSALLHAGLLNAGPFLVARMSFMVGETTYAPIVLIIFGGFTALFGSIAYMTQSSVKTALGYSSISHMGFSLLLCGFGIYAAAMLHLVAHSFYKAHAFLSSGSFIDVKKASKIELPERKANLLVLVISIGLAFTIFGFMAYAWGINPIEELSLLVISCIIVMGLSLLIATALDSYGSKRLIPKVVLMAALVALAFFSLETLMGTILKSQIPVIMQPSTAVVILLFFWLIVFAGIVLIQIFSPFIKDSSFWRKWSIHFRNGLYANVVYDRVVGALYVKDSKPDFIKKYE
ncbi:NADH dehydrogenase [Marivirga tractuosa]|uniref:Probable inorganic carbon transporter subunit DabB n=1 Tax=Marivirga tractuosa (strain ATCC 23168 / DSM 4126 / NBRC 15989 / NCIMB 1408 / VKM B-1430 / H-43) TaxID=643867 RepID=E4TLT8_MARTH|nr:proton-conducting transporter membrane subunit [Marivirga tractuosa]ADR23367.1 NADH/Ubiquinone/plastoquinone (complex I) [Marivirga tractuosa DSM 4126]BDD15958.1 NADH dehydrogenase [Marivirga tractuosa]